MLVTFAGGLIKQFPPVAASLEDFLDLIRRIGRRLGEIEVQFDARHPKLDLQLPDGSRMFAVYGGAGTNGVGAETYLCIRRHRFLEPSVDDLVVELGLWPAKAAIDSSSRRWRHGENVIIAGDWAVGEDDDCCEA